jgi:hypothetical protein
MSLKDWQERNKWLTLHNPSRREIRDLLAGAEQDLRQSAAEGLGPDWRMAIAYNAFLRGARAALAAAGYRVARGTDHHYTVIQSVALTVGWPQTRIETVDGFRRKRNLAGYETAGIVTAEEAKEMVELATQLRQDVYDWILANHPELV